MSQQDKGRLWRALKDSGVKFEKAYRDYTTDQLQVSYDALAAVGEAAPLEPVDGEAYAKQGTLPQPGAAERYPQPQPGVSGPDPNERAGMRLNQKEEDEPIRTDELGRIWFQEEILKPASPRPRARRVLSYIERGVKSVTQTNGDFTETFEVAGDEQERQAQVKVTLPSYQVGLYKDPRFPWRVHTYNNMTGFHLKDIEDFFGGRELVPDEIKRAYVENVLCYDIRTTIRTIEMMDRQLRLQQAAPGRLEV